MDKQTLKELQTVIANCKDNQDIILYCKDSAEEFIIDYINILNNNDIEITIKWRN